MDYVIRRLGKLHYIDASPDGGCIRSEQDALDWVAICGEHETTYLMLYDGNLADDFFDLSSGVAGEILLKFVIYSIRVAAVLSSERVNHGKFPEMMIETNRGNDFRVFLDKDKAEEWFMQLGAG